MVFIAAFLLASCYPFNLSLKPDGAGPGNQKNPDPVPVSLSLGDYTGDYTVAYADGTIIKSITTDAETILIGRPYTDSIEMNLDSGGSLDFRDPDGDGYIPIGAYAEFQLINTEPGALAGSYRQVADLDLMNEEWTPVGKYDPVDPDNIWNPANFTPFTGTFDGDGKHIDNLFIDDNTADFVGLFGMVKGTVEDVHVRSGSVTGHNCVAGVVASLGIGDERDTASPKTVSLCSNAAVISGTSSVGGVVGMVPAYAGGGYPVLGAKIISCYNTGNVTGTTLAAGGVVGYLSTAETIACYNTGNVTGLQGVGGVVGISNYTAVIACYNKGSVSGQGTRGGNGDANGAGVGGVVGCLWAGWTNNSLTACYNTGSVTITGGDTRFAGGVVGFSTAAASYIYNNYWFDVSGDHATYGIGEDPVGSDDIGPSSVNATPFSGTAWPTTGTHTQWGIGNGSGNGKYWKSLGGWDSVNPIYPRLWYEP
jgi:hypothetical protein